MKVEDAMKVSSLGALLEMQPYLEAEVHKMEANLEMRIYALLGDGKLTPELALAGWLEKMTYNRFLKRIQQRIRIGQTAAKNNEVELNATAPTYTDDKFLPLP